MRTQSLRSQLTGSTLFILTCLLAFGSRVAGKDPAADWRTTFQTALQVRESSGAEASLPWFARAIDEA